MVIKGAAYVVDLKRTEALPKEGASVTSAAAPRPASKGAGLDRVEISSKSLELEKLKRDLDALPEVRLDRVALAKQNMQEGGYRLEPGVLARKMMEAYGTY